MLVLSKLKWDLSAVTPHDFLEQILSRICPDPERCNVIKKHSQTFIALCSTGKIPEPSTLLIYSSNAKFISEVFFFLRVQEMKWSCVRCWEVFGMLFRSVGVFFFFFLARVRAVGRDLVLCAGHGIHSLPEL